MRVSRPTSRWARLLAACAVLAATAASATGCASARVGERKPEERHFPIHEGDTGRVAEPKPADRLFPIYEGDRVGYIDRAGKVVIPPKYGLSLPADFVEGLARVVVLDAPGLTRGGPDGVRRPYRVGFIDATDRMVVEPVYDDAKPFREGLAAVGRNGKYGYVDRRGNVRIPLQFDHAESFSEGLARVTDAAGVRFIDQAGKTIIDMNAVRWAGKPLRPVGDFSEGMVPVSTAHDPQRMGFMDRAGRIVIEPRFAWAYGFYGGYAHVTEEGSGGALDRKSGIIDRHGTFVVPARYRLLGLMHDGMAWFMSDDGKRGFLNARNDVVIDPVYEFVGDFSEGLCPVKRAGRWAYIDREGREVVELPAGTRYASSFVEGLAPLESDMGWGFIRRDGTPAFGAYFRGASRFVDGLASVVLDGRTTGYVNREGRLVYQSEKPLLLLR